MCPLLFCLVAPAARTIVSLTAIFPLLPSVDCVESTKRKVEGGAMGEGSCKNNKTAAHQVVKPLEFVVSTGPETRSAGGVGNVQSMLPHKPK